MENNKNSNPLDNQEQLSSDSGYIEFVDTRIIEAKEGKSEESKSEGIILPKELIIKENLPVKEDTITSDGHYTYIRRQHSEQEIDYDALIVLLEESGQEFDETINPKTGLGIK